MIIQATNLPRVIACEGSVAMERLDRPIAPQSESAREGTAAHELASAVLYRHIADASERIGKQAANGIFITAEMADYVTRYTSALAARMFAVPPQVHVESNVDYVLPNVEVHGRADFILWDAGTQTLYIDDFKYGFRLVEPDENWTLISHAIGYVIRERIQPKRIVFTIHQPRPHHPSGKSVRDWSISGDQLNEFLEFLRNFFETRGNSLTTGPHCYECPAYATCPAARAAETNAIDVSHAVAFTDDISNDDLAALLLDIERAADVLKSSEKALSELAQHRLERGDIIPGRALEIGYGNRQWKPGVTAGMLAMLSGVDIDKLSERKLKSPRQAELAKVPETVVNLFSQKPITGVKLIKQDISKAAAKAFGGQ